MGAQVLVLGCPFRQVKGEMGIAIETQTEIPNPMYSTQGLLPSHPDQAAPVSCHATSQEHLCGQGTRDELQAWERGLSFEAVAVSAGDLALSAARV